MKTWVCIIVIVVVSTVAMRLFWRSDLKGWALNSFTRSISDGEGAAVRSRIVTVPDAEDPTVTLAEPIPNFAKRVTKKPFGIYITPKASPVQPERFSGYHTGVDAEISPDELTRNFFVKAVTDGDVVIVKWASGYGGLVVIQHQIAEQTVYGIYGHLRISSVLLKTNSHVKAGDIIGVLGDNLSEETDNERKHLHFGLFKGEVPDIRGYVQTPEELMNWINPLQFF